MDAEASAHAALLPALLSLISLGSRVAGSGWIRTHPEQFVRVCERTEAARGFCARVLLPHSHALGMAQRRVYETRASRTHVAPANRRFAVFASSMGLTCS